MRLSELPPGDTGRVEVRARAIEWHLPMAAYPAGRFAGRGGPLADLTQVALIGLIKAVDPHRTVSVQQPAPGHDDLHLIDLLLFTDPGIEAVDNRETLSVLLAELPTRERLVIRLRFCADMTQSQIATEIGISQMLVSRLLTRTLTDYATGCSLTPIPQQPEETRDTTAGTDNAGRQIADQEPRPSIL